MNKDKAKEQIKAAADAFLAAIDAVADPRLIDIVNEDFWDPFNEAVGALEDAVDNRATE